MNLNKMVAKRRIKVRISDLKLNLFVRKELNTDRVEQLWELLENGVKLADIKINPDMIVIDGRHRIEANIVKGNEFIEAEVFDITDETDLIAAAYQANIGGALPPSTADTEHTIMLLLSKGETHKHIAEVLQLPIGLTRRYVREVQSKTRRVNLKRAIEAVATSNMTVVKAAEAHGVEEDTLREALSGARKKNKKGLPDLKRTLTKRFQSVGQQNAATFRKLADQLEDGDVTPVQVGEILDHIEHLIGQAGRTVAERRKRFEALGVPQKKEK